MNPLSLSGAIRILKRSLFEARFYIFPLRSQLEKSTGRDLQRREPPSLQFWIVFYLNPPNLPEDAGMAVQRNLGSQLIVAQLVSSSNITGSPCNSDLMSPLASY